MKINDTEKREYWKSHIDAWRRSGESQASYCRRHQLKVHQMQYWRQVLSDAQTSSDDGNTGFVAIDIPPKTMRPDFTITLPNGIKVSGASSHHLELVKSMMAWS